MNNARPYPHQRGPRVGTRRTSIVFIRLKVVHNGPCSQHTRTTSYSRIKRQRRCKRRRSAPHGSPLHIHRQHASSRVRAVWTAPHDVAPRHEGVSQRLNSTARDLSPISHSAPAGCRRGPWAMSDHEIPLRVGTCHQARLAILESRQFVRAAYRPLDLPRQQNPATVGVSRSCVIKSSKMAGRDFWRQNGRPTLSRWCAGGCESVVTEDGAR